MYNTIELNNKLVGELRYIAKSLNIPSYDVLKKQELILKILDYQALTTNVTEMKDNSSNPEEQKPKRPRRPRVEQAPPSLQENKNSVDEDLIWIY